MRQLTTLVALLVALVLGSTATAAPIIIDNFSNLATRDAGSGLEVPAGITNVYPNYGTNGVNGQRGFDLSTISAPASLAALSASSIVVNETGLTGVFGGNRTTVLKFISATAPNNLTVNIAPGFNSLSYNAGNAVLGSLRLIYTFPSTNFSGQAGFLLNFLNNSASPLTVKTTITDGGSSSFTTTQSGTGTLFVPFSSFIGSANLSSLNSVRFDFTVPVIGGQSFGLGPISTFEVPEPATLAVCGIFGIAGLVGARRKLKKSVEPTVAA